MSFCWQLLCIKGCQHYLVICFFFFFLLFFRFIMNHNGLQTDAQRKVQPDFRAASMIFDKHLYDENVNSMKFLCHGLVEASKLELIQEAHELIDLLQSANHVTEKNYSLLADLLQFIGRIDVLQKIGSDEMDVMVNRFNGGSKINPFYVLLFKLAKELPDEDVQKATCMYGKVPKSQKVLSGIDLLTVMVQHQAVRPDNVSLLTTIFGTIGRQDIVELINRYTGRNWWEYLQFSVFFSPISLCLPRYSYSFINMCSQVDI